MKKIVLICLLLISLTGCINIYKPDRNGFYLTEYGSIKYSEENYYIDDNSDTILILDNNKFVDYIKKNNEHLFLFEDNECLYVKNYETNSIQQIGKLDEKDIEFKKYKLEYYNTSNDYVECKLLKDNRTLLEFTMDNKSVKGIYSSYMYYIDNYIYITSLRYAVGGNPNSDMMINGTDFLGSDLYKIDTEKKQVDLIYSTDNTQAIAYGNENIVYYSDDEYNLHRLNIQNGSDSIVYDGKECKKIIVSYTHNKFYIYTDVEDIVIDVEFDDKEQ